MDPTGLRGHSKRCRGGRGANTRLLSLCFTLAIRGANPRITFYSMNPGTNLLGNIAFCDPFPFPIEQLHLNYCQPFLLEMFTYLWFLGNSSQPQCKWAPLSLFWLPWTPHVFSLRSLWGLDQECSFCGNELMTMWWQGAEADWWNNVSDVLCNVGRLAHGAMYW